MCCLVIITLLYSTTILVSSSIVYVWRKSFSNSRPCFSTEETLSASVTSQPSHQKENVIPLLVTSNSDQFLTTPDGEEKDITQENSELKHRSAKKDLLDIDRFTICGNRIDWILRLPVPSAEAWGSHGAAGADRCKTWHLYIYLKLKLLTESKSE